MRIFGRSLRKFDALRRVLESTPGRHKEPSLIVSADDELTRPSERLFDLSFSAINRARAVDFPDLASRTSSEPRWYNVWPGEHYKLLAALVGALGARQVIEIGTSTGMGTLALAQFLPPGGHITTFDIVPWREFKQTWLRDSDFASDRIAQEIADIAKPGGIAPFTSWFQGADFIFIDGPKDGVTEQKFIDALVSLRLPKKPLIMFDDIRVLNMIEIWRRLDHPKMDLTSFGHWSGTGLVDWNA
jgi:predicted O-methyltransferase YrrM